jgi:prophage regulatory protein
MRRKSDAQRLKRARQLRAVTQLGPVNRRFLRISQVLAATGLAQSTLYELIARGEFPRAIPLSPEGRRVAWAEDEVEAWQAARIAARDGSVA